MTRWITTVALLALAAGAWAAAPPDPETLARGKTAIVLVPEIALTLWIGRQCRAWFGAQFEGVAVLHSALSDVERNNDCARSRRSLST